MKSLHRHAAIALVAATTVAAAAPAFAASTSPTSLNLRAGKTTVAAKTKDPFTATLTSKGKPLAAATVWLQERTAPTSTHKTTWKDVTSTTTNTSGKATFSVAPPLASGKSTQKDQYRAWYKSSMSYGGSYSAVVTVTVKKA